MKIKLLYRQYLALIIVPFLLLTGCGSNQSPKKLRAYFAHLKQAPVKNTIDAISKLELPETASFQANNARSPFSKGENMYNKSSTPTDPLQTFPLSVLRFIGTLLKNNIIYAYVLTPDNKIYQVKIGDKIGDHYGKIIEISNTKLNVEEVSTDDTQPGTKRTVTLELKDGNG